MTIYQIQYYYNNEKFFDITNENKFKSKIEEELKHFKKIKKEYEIKIERIFADKSISKKDVLINL